ncbi:hypothetical protein VQ042_04890 [Aurantimonas sp. A2-1-M11]|uniref:hypothetical protein n=1 Tax=Aurantimonas sp. A2-1-M11 TaxID=3113712 RepID=UPI002F946B5A
MLNIVKIAVAAVLAMTLAAVAQGNDEKVNVLQYALSHPSDNAQMQRAPALGDSVPASVNLQQANGNTSFAYFYWAGQPVIVDLKTRSIVRIGG